MLLALAAVVALGIILGRLCSYLGQPPVIGEVIAGIVLGPSLLGWVAPAAHQFLLPSSVAPALGIIAQIGVVLYMFLVGLELNGATLRGRAHAAPASGKLDERIGSVVPMTETTQRRHTRYEGSLLCIVAAPEGIAAVQAAHPTLPIYTPAVDRELNSQKFILPGLGDFGDRLYGTA